MAYTDAFAGVNGTDLTTYNAVWVWVGPTEKLEIQSNAVAMQGLGSGGGYLYNQTFNSKHYAQLKITAGGRYVGPGIRVQAGGNFYQCFVSIGEGSSTYPGECIAGSFTDWDSGQAELNTNDVARLEVDATTETTIHYKVNGSTVQTYTGKSNLSGGRAGLSFYNANIAIRGDDWEGGDVGGGATGNPWYAYAQQ